MDSSTLVSAIGICCALAGMAVLIFKRVTPVIIGPLAAVLVCLTSKIPVFSGLTETYLSGVAGFFTSYVFIFLLGNIFGNIYQNSGAAAKIGMIISKKRGPKKSRFFPLSGLAPLSFIWSLTIIISPTL